MCSIYLSVGDYQLRRGLRPVYSAQPRMIEATILVLARSLLLAPYQVIAANDTGTAAQMTMGAQRTG